MSMKQYLFIILAITIYSCSSNKEDSGESKKEKESKISYLAIKGETQGTFYNITYKDTLNRNLKESIDSILLDFDNSLSTYNSASLITEFNSYKEVQLDSFFYNVHLLSKEIYQKTDGSFNPSLFSLVSAWGFGLQDAENVTQELIDSLLPNCNYDSVYLKKKETVFPDQINWQLTTNKNTEIEYNAIAQGYSVDVIGQYLKKLGINNYMIEIGGEVLCNGISPKGNLWKIGIDKPIKTETLDQRELQTIITVNNEAVATSGNYRKFYEKDGVKYSHTINPKTGRPVEHSLLSVTVITDGCGKADAYATAFMVMGVKGTKSFLMENKDLNIEVYLIYDENGVNKTYSSKGLESKMNDLS